MQITRRDALAMIGCTTLPGVLAGRGRAQSSDPAAWPMDEHDAGATNATLDARVEAVTDHPGEDLVVASGTRFYRQRSGDTAILVARGNANWETDRRVLGTPVYEQGVLYAVVQDEGRTVFVAFDAASGAVQWELPLVDDTPDGDAGNIGGGGDWQSPLRRCGSFVYGFSGDRLYCVDLDNRQIQWSVQGRFVDFAVEPGAVESGIVVTTGDSIRAFDVRSGDQRWRVNEAGGGNVAVQAGYLVHTSTAIRVFDVTDGTKQWEEQISESEPGSGSQLESDFLTAPAVTANAAYVAVNRSSLSPVGGRHSGDVRGYRLSTGTFLGSSPPPTLAEPRPRPDDSPDDGEWLTIQVQDWSSPVRASDGLYIGYSDSLMSFEADGSGNYWANAEGLARVSVNDAGQLQDAERLTEWTNNETLVVADTTLYQ